MCQPSASRAIELNIQPPATSAIMVTAVSTTAQRVLRSARGLPASKTSTWHSLPVDEEDSMVNALVGFYTIPQYMF